MEFVSMAWGNQMGSEFFSSPSRLIPTLTGTQYGTIDTPIVANAGDTLEIKFATTSAGVSHMLCDSDILTSRGYIYFPAADTIDWLAGQVTAVTLDGVVATSGVTAAPNDGKVHTIVATFAAGARVGIIGAQYNFNTPFKGQILSTKFTDKSGAEDVVTNIVFDSGSATDQPSRSGNNNVSLSGVWVWNRYTLQRNIVHDAGSIAEAWVGADVVVNGGFDTDTDWVKGVGWTIAGGIASCDGSQIAASTDLAQDLTAYFSENDIVLASYLQSNYVIGNTNSVLGASTTLTNSSNGRFTRVGIVGAFATFGVRADINFIGSVDNVSVQHLLEIA